MSLLAHTWNLRLIAISKGFLPLYFTRYEMAFYYLEQRNIFHFYVTNYNGTKIYTITFSNVFSISVLYVNDKLQAVYALDSFSRPLSLFVSLPTPYYLCTYGITTVLQMWMKKKRSFESEEKKRNTDKCFEKKNVGVNYVIQMYNNVVRVAVSIYSC